MCVAGKLAAPKRSFELLQLGFPQQACAVMHSHDADRVSDQLVDHAIVADDYLAYVFLIEFRNDAPREGKFGQSTSGRRYLVD